MTSIPGIPVTAYVVEADGSVTHAIIVWTSGHELLDNAAIERSMNRHFDSPGTLDGIAVRVLLTTPLTFKFKRLESGLPIAFTDAFINESTLQVNVRVYEMAYALDLARPGDENVLMSVSVADRASHPRIVTFRLTIHPSH